MRYCTIDGCNNKHNGLGYCNAHRLRLKRHGSPLGGEKREREYHGKTNTSEFKSWQMMKDRCHNVNGDGYPTYGAVGITVCDRWRSSFGDFYKDMGSKPTSLHTLDRIDPLKGYSPENCRWADKSEQNANKVGISNKTGFKGIWYIKAENKWMGRVQFRGKKYHTKRFSTPKEAALAYDLIAKRVHREFAQTNF